MGKTLIRVSGRLRVSAAHVRGVIVALMPGLFFRHVGWGTAFFGWPRLAYWGTDIQIGRRCMVGKGVFLSVGPRGTVSIGDSCSVNDYCYITCLERIAIGKGTAIGEFVSIRDYDHEFDGHQSVRELGFRISPITIGENVWIGRGVMICRGISIGDGAVIGANSVVTRDIPAGSVAVGAPARVIRPSSLPESSV
jgi:serine acetyltransferase